MYNKYICYKFEFYIVVIILSYINSIIIYYYNLKNIKYNNPNFK